MIPDETVNSNKNSCYRKMRRHSLILDSTKLESETDKAEIDYKSIIESKKTFLGFKGYFGQPCLLVRIKSGKIQKWRLYCKIWRLFIAVTRVLLSKVNYG